MERIVEGKDCCGCAACAEACARHAISMKADKRGFLYPKVDSNICVDCNACKLTCPILKRDSKTYEIGKQEYYACHNNDEHEWKASSSGGLFRVLADYVMERGGYVVGAVYDEKMVVRHFATNKKEDLVRFRGSKYVQSDTRKIYRQIENILKEDNWVLFTGTPCQVEALKCFLRKPYEKLLACDIICTAVPSPRAFGDYVLFLEKKYGHKVIGVNMKDKTQGWPYAKTRVFFDNGESIYNNIDADLWLKAWGSNLINRPSCTTCRFTNYNRPGDITIGDCWPVFHKKNSFFSPNGISQILINTPKGFEVFAEIENRLTLLKITKEYSWQSKLERPIANNPQTDIFWEEYISSSFKDISRKYWDYHPFKNRIRGIVTKVLIMIETTKNKILKK